MVDRHDQLGQLLYELVYLCVAPPFLNCLPIYAAALYIRHPLASSTPGGRIRHPPISFLVISALHSWHCQTAFLLAVGPGSSAFLAQSC
jgi:hypothetical protein